MGIGCNLSIYIQAKCCLLSYWANLVNCTKCKLSNIFDYFLYKMNEAALFTSNWIRFVKSNVNALVYSEMYLVYSEM